MWVAYSNQIFLCYAAIGIFWAALLFMVFRPEDSYRPPVWIRLSAFVTFFVLWPVIVLIAICYLIGVLYRRHTGEEPTQTISFRESIMFRVYDDSTFSSK